MAKKAEQVSNGAAVAVEMQKPFSVEVRIMGTTDIIFHRWNSEDVEAKQAAKKGSDIRKMDVLENYVYRNAAGEICLPAQYVYSALVAAGKNFQDPRSSRRQARDLIKASVIVTPQYIPILKMDGKGKERTVKEWDYDHQARASVMRASVNRVRPAILEGWRASFSITSLSPELVTPGFLRSIVDAAGLYCGLGDFRPTYGRFCIVGWDFNVNLTVKMEEL